MNQIYRWLKYPLKQKSKSFSIRLYNFIFFVIKPITKFDVFNKKIFSMIKYDLSNRNDFLITKTNKNEHFIITGKDIVIGKSLYIENKPHNFHTLEVALKLLPKTFDPHTIIDVGANIGTVCIPSIKRGIFKSAIAIEPEPLNYSLLMANIYLNKIEKNIKSYNIALGNNDNEKLLFEISENNFGDNRIIVQNMNGLFDETNRNKIEITSQKFDSFLNIQNPMNTLLFIYTQGYEGHVLNGAKNALTGNPPLILLFCPYTMKRASSLEIAINTLIEAKYKYFFILNKDIQSKVNLNKANLLQLCNELGYEGGFSDLLII